MKIHCIEIQNFRKLKSTRIDLDTSQTLFVGANNSGKTSAMLALRYFLIDQLAFSYRDISISNWDALVELGRKWETQSADDKPVYSDLVALLPAMDVWLDVKDNELHHVVHLIPTLDWQGGNLGIRMRLEPKKPEKLRAEYLAERQAARINVRQGVRNQFWPKNVIGMARESARLLSETLAQPLCRSILCS